jgi:hypothetical protein
MDAEIGGHDPASVTIALEQHLGSSLRGIVHPALHPANRQMNLLDGTI